MTTETREQAGDDELVARFRLDAEEFTAVYDRYFHDVYLYAAVRHQPNRPPPAQRGTSLPGAISEAPVSPEVRAAAYRALAARPGVQDLGDADGGRRLQVPVLDGQETLTIDPETGQLRNTSVWAPLTGGTAHSSGPVTIATEWTDRLPD
ncbi:hypothetical protein [Nonomuraea sp. NPDC003754]